MTKSEMQDATLVSLETKTGIAKAAWSRYKNGYIAPTFATIEEIAKSLEMEPIEVFAVMYCWWKY